MTDFVLGSLKAFVPIVGALVLVGLSNLGVGPSMSVSDAVNLLLGGLVGSVAVWFVPNKK